MTRKSPAVSLRTAVAGLARLYRAPKPLADPLAILVWDNVGYLVDDAKRAELFAEFERRIGLKARDIANAPMAIVADIARRGGMAPQKRAERLIEIGRLAIAECDGKLVAALRALPVPKARALLKKFPSVGDPGADRIMLFSDIAPLACADSNGLRALVRLGFCAEGKSYAATYKSAVAALGAAGKDDADWLKRAYLVLREHGKTLCKRAAPICEPCPLDKSCAHKTLASTL